MQSNDEIIQDEEALPPSLDELKSAVADHLERKQRELAGARSRRDDLNLKIKSLAAEVEEAKRTNSALNRKPRTKKK